MICETPTAMGGCMDQWVGQWVGSGQMTKIKLYMILFEDTYVDEWVNG